ncbi:MAG: hypothetical protein KJ620_01805 [Candidatus Edwardsbacteria bacterium]|nr:hypothetical protein [Candidatus Edwardsbacteria bacterium]MBU1575668.1 hypothetical protein [Candidatus Edwardsbacteria bacterium]MBU2463759.1 hypothetical protein [Candidatus Edwardsbacteria bacterium]MBU2594060.1 hypothetical protein [Candidatus Edwardsbacteria bacterium]
MRKYAVITILGILMLTSFAQGQLLVDNFDYTAGTNLTDNGWTAHSSGGTNPITVSSGGLTYTDYASSGIGNAALVDSTGEDVSRTFDLGITSGSVYASFLVNVGSGGAPTGYFLHLGPNPIGTTFLARVNVMNDAGSNLEFGLQKTTETAVYTDNNYSYGTTYLVVLKYTFYSGSTTNDSLCLYVMSSGAPSSEPATPTIGPIGAAGADAAELGTIALRQYNAAQRITVDGIRVGTSWTDIVPAVSGGSDVSAGAGSEPASISSLLDTDAEKVLNFDFRVKDDSTGGDALNTLIDKIVITKGTGNDISDWSGIIAGVKLFDGSADSASGTVYADSIVFSGIDHSSGRLGEVTDNGSKTYHLKIWLKGDLGSFQATIDNSNLAFKVDRTSFTVDAAGTPFASGAGTAVESGASNNAVTVAATRLNIASEPPASVDVSVDFGLSVEAADGNGNRDLDAANSVTLTLLGGMGNLTSATGLTQNLASGLRAWSDLQYDLAEGGLTIEAAASGLVPDTTISFAAIGGAPSVQASNIVFSEVSENQLIISWTNGNGSARMVLVQQGSPVDADPVDGNSYFPSSTYGMGQQIGTGNYTVFSSSGNCDTILGLAPNTTYHFAVYEYNGSGGTENYLTLNPAVDSQLTTEHFDAGDYRSLKTGIWTDISSWETYNGTIWGAASQPPCSTNNIIIRAIDTVTVDAEASCKNAIFLGANYGTRLDISDYTLSVHGMLNADGVTLNDYLIRCNSGRLKFVGSARALFGENWGAYGTRWRMEVALASGDTGTSSKNVKASDIIISSGVFKGGDVRADSGAVLTGTMSIAAGSSLIAQRVSRTSTATVPCRKIVVDGVLQLTGSNVSADSIFVNNGAYLRSSSATGQIVTGVLQYAGGSTLEYAGTSAQHTRQELQETMPNIVINNTSGVTMDTTTTVVNSLTLDNGNLNTGIDSLILGSSATLSGEQAGRYVIGKLLTSRTVGTGSSSFGGIGVSLNSGADDLGTVNVRRISGPAGVVVASITGANADTGITRRWNLTSDNPPSGGRSLTLSWVSDDDNGRDLTSAQLWKSLDGGSTWTVAFSPHDVSSSRSITESVTSFSAWTVSDAANPLPVQLASFTGAVENRKVLLKWITSYEAATDSWKIERSTLSGGPYHLSGEIEAYGQPHQYQWIDNSAGYNTQYYYRLAQIDTDGKIVYYGPVMVASGAPAFSVSRLLFCGPSPFRSSARISYQVGQGNAEVNLTVYNIVGQAVHSRYLGDKASGSYETNWDGSDDRGRKLSTGVYFVNLKIGQSNFMKRLTLLR